jgi:putative PIN family toxin of toxin-antitoxin system
VLPPPPKTQFKDILDAFFAGEFVPVYSQETFDELLRILTTSQDVAKRFNVDPVKGGEFVGLVLTKAGEEVEITGSMSVSSDVDDNMFAEVAYVGKVDFLVSNDRDLHESAVVAALKVVGVRVLWPNSFRAALRKLRAVKG